MPMPPLTIQEFNHLTTLALDLTQAATNDVFQIGEFLIGSGDTSNLGGHPDIRY